MTEQETLKVEIERSLTKQREVIEKWEKKIAMLKAFVSEVQADLREVEGESHE